MASSILLGVRLARLTAEPLAASAQDEEMQLLPSRRLQKYLIDGRLADVLALIQVLALDEHAHRSEDGLVSELQGRPASAETWTEVAAAHREFFRVKPDGEHRVSLVARHVLPKNDLGVRVLPSEFAGRLLDAAIDLHDRQVKLAERWTYLVPIWVACIVGLFSITAAILKSCGSSGG